MQEDGLATAVYESYSLTLGPPWLGLSLVAGSAFSALSL